MTELVVVIVILAIIATVLLPIFFNVRESARQTTCASNLRQLAIALTMYADDSDGYFPTLNLGNGSHFAIWDDQITSYTKSRDVFHCPDVEIPTSFVPPPGLITRGYGVNIEISGVYRYKQFLRTISASVEFPATTVTLCEEGFTQGTKGAVSTGPGIFAESDAPNDVADLEPGQEFVGLPGATRHRGGSNYGFADCHVRWYRPDQVKAGRTSNGDTIPNTGTNPSFAL